MLVPVRIRLRPEDVRALEATAKCVTRVDFTTPVAPDACARATTTALEGLGFGAQISGSTLMAGGRSGLQRVVVRGTFTPRAGETDVSIVGMVGEVIPVSVALGVLPVPIAAATFYGCFVAGLPPAIAGLGMVVVPTIFGIAWWKWRARTANATAAVLHDAFEKLRARSGT
jgi:hypothetical protein